MALVLWFGQYKKPHNNIIAAKDPIMKKYIKPAKNANKQLLRDLRKFQAIYDDSELTRQGKANAVAYAFGNRDTQYMIELDHIDTSCNPWQKSKQCSVVHRRLNARAVMWPKACTTLAARKRAIKDWRLWMS